MLKTERIDFLQKVDFTLPVDLSPIFFCEQVRHISLIHYIPSIPLCEYAIMCIIHKKREKVALHAVTWLKWTKIVQTGWKCSEFSKWYSLANRSF